MIAFVHGTICDLTENSVVVEAGGLGYEILMTAQALGQLRIGQEVKLYTYFQVREDAMALYGFPTKDALSVFSLLLGVNGIGPKAALGILGSLQPDALRFAIMTDDVKTISQAPGIGKKTAQKLILELKDKFNLQDAFAQKLEGTGTEAPLAAAGEGDVIREAVEALSALGYGGAEAMKAVRKVENLENLSVEEVLKAALKHI